jgi:hypothetical protein
MIYLPIPPSITQKLLLRACLPIHNFIIHLLDLENPVHKFCAQKTVKFINLPHWYIFSKKKLKQ